jgi:hypothetical protein
VFSVGCFHATVLLFPAVEGPLGYVMLTTDFSDGLAPISLT